MTHLLRPVIVLVFTFHWLAVHAQRQDKINPEFDNVFNPFRQALGIPQRFSVKRDSVLVPHPQGGHLVLRLNNGRLWGLECYDKNGKPVDTGTLNAGTGSVSLVYAGIRFDAEFEGGLLHGEVWRSGRSFGNTYPHATYTFEAGLLHGDSRIYSSFSRHQVVVIRTHEGGYLTRVRQYGKLKPGFALLYPLVRLVDHEFLCSEWLFEKGKPVSHQCFVKKCRRCAR